MLRIPQPAHTYAVTGIMNEHQLAIGETTFDGREELENTQGGIPYWTLMRLALQRARTAREAIKVMTDLVAEYGYASTGESFSIGDPNEAWILEMIGPGPGGKGAHLGGGAGARRHDLRPRQQVAHRHVPAQRPGQLPVLARTSSTSRSQKGYYDPKTRRRRSASATPTARPRPQKLRYTETRVWSIFRRAAPSQELRRSTTTAASRARSPTRSGSSRTTSSRCRTSWR